MKSEGKCEKFKCEDTPCRCSVSLLSVPILYYVSLPSPLLSMSSSPLSLSLLSEFRFLAQLSTHGECMCSFLNDFFITTYGLHDLVQSINQFIVCAIPIGVRSNCLRSIPF